MPEFYEALYEFNRYEKEPLYIMHGVWIDEELMLKKMNAFDKSVIESFKHEITQVIDVIHGNAKIEKKSGRGFGDYKYDISPYLVGYILGIEWDSSFVEETNNKNKNMKDYNGMYVYTENANPIEIFFADVAENTIKYEETNYNMQKPIAFTNWLTTDVIEHKNDMDEANRIGDIDTDKIKQTNRYKSGLFASYHVYPYYPDFLNYDSKYADFVDENGKKNSYKAYLKDLKKYHNVPVIVSEFGVPESRGITHEDLSRGFNQGLINENQQGQMNKEMLNDIVDEGYAGAIVFSWQDEWFKRTWNTMDIDDSNSRAYWADKMTNEQFFGLLSFDPGKNKQTVYIDGKVNDWSKRNIISENNDIKLYAKSDEQYLYLRINKKDLDLFKEDIIIPLDITPNSGSYTINNYNTKFNKKADFVIEIKNKEDAKIVVNDYYNVNDFLFRNDIKDNKNENRFDTVKQVILGESEIPNTNQVIDVKEVEVGNLTYGNSNPKSKDYNSLADFIVSKDDIEIRIPWLMLNISNPAKKLIIDDFNEKREIKHIEIDGINSGAYIISNNKLINSVEMKKYNWNKWDMPRYHERLKQSYYIMKDAFKEIK
ncbi:family 2 glycosyl transferase [[Clostridium] dakarense]|nr:family 2 glycosyl transferase [[Clostridium] dakarense]